MPPTIARPVVPSGTTDPCAKSWLEHVGLLAKTPPIRSSMFGDAEKAPFRLYLESRLGICSPFRKSEALNVGTYFHVAGEQIGNEPAVAVHAVEQAIALRKKEIGKVCRQLKMTETTRVRMCEDEEDDARFALALFLAAEKFRLPNNAYLKNGFTGYFRQSRWQHLAVELRVRYVDPDYPNAVLCCTIDKLLFDKKKNLLWIVDYKTTSFSPIMRAQTVRAEPQPIHYLHILEGTLRLIIERYELPSATKLGGVLHMIVRKPSSSMRRPGTADRDFCYISQSKRAKLAGSVAFTRSKIIVIVRTWNEAEPDDNKLIHRQEFAAQAEDALAKAIAFLEEKVTTKAKKEYIGEPSWERFNERVVDWELGRGNFADEDRGSDPPVNFSRTPMAEFRSPRRQHAYHKRLRRVYDLLTCDADPVNFPETAEGMLAFTGRSLSPFADFHVTEPHQWLDVMRRNHLLPGLHRDADIIDDACITALD